MSASDSSRTAATPAAEESGDDAAILAAHFRALRRLHSAVEHQLRSPLNSIGLNLELLAAEISDLAERDDPGSRGSAATLGQVLGALRGGYARLIDSTDSVLNAVLPIAGRVEPVDLARLVRRVAGLGGTESVLLRATWRADLPDVPIPIESRPDLLLPALLALVCSALARAGAGARIALSLHAESEGAEVRVEVEPGRAEEDLAAEERRRRDLSLLADGLGATLREGAEGDVFRVHLSLPRRFGAAAC